MSKYFEGIEWKTVIVTVVIIFVLLLVLGRRG